MHFLFTDSDQDLEDVFSEEEKVNHEEKRVSLEEYIMVNTEEEEEIIEPENRENLETNEVSPIIQENVKLSKRQKRENKVNCDENKQLTRKRKRQPENWKMNVNRRACQTGREYQDVKGKMRKERCFKTNKDCETKCKYLCAKKISLQERGDIFNGFWGLSNDAKLNFYDKNTEKIKKNRKQTAKKDSRRRYTFKYYFHVSGNKIRTCKAFFLSTLDVSQQRVNYFHLNKKNAVTGIPSPSKQGHHPKKVISEINKQHVRNHINNIPRVASHYCRMDSKKEYFEGTLNIGKLYNLYVEFCTENQIEPVKKHCYVYIFNYEFNIDFLKPKKDRCDACEEYLLIQKGGTEITEQQKIRFEKHLQGKTSAKTVRDVDRKNEDERTAIVCFDMENVFALPQSNISCFFYSRKLNTYNLTAHCNLNKQAYCCIWSEGTHGRQGNDIASALIKILERVVKDFPHINKMILWSDSCVPQNKNSIMSLALMKFLEKYPDIEEIIQKFCEPGHSSIQEVDNIHSQIQRKLSSVEIFSPLGLLRHLGTVNRRHPFKVFHMTHKDFYQFKEASQTLNFKKIPYASLKQIMYCPKLLTKLYYKLHHHDENFTEVPINSSSKTRATIKNSIVLPAITISPEPKQCLLPFAKVADLTKLFKFMPSVDITFIRTFFKEYNDTTVFSNSKKAFQKAKANSKVSESNNRKVNKTSSNINKSTKGKK